MSINVKSIVFYPKQAAQAAGLSQPPTTYEQLQQLTDTIAANTTLMYDKVNSEEIAAEDLDYDRFQAYIGIRWFM